MLLIKDTLEEKPSENYKKVSVDRCYSAHVRTNEHHFNPQTNM